MSVNVNTLREDEYFFGHKACAGCGGALAVRIALKVIGPNAIATIPAGCMSAVGFNFPQLCFKNNAIISTFAGTASMMTGIEAGLKALGKKDYKVVGFAGDGGTADIGIQALSGAIDRNDDVLYICYDNEAYMNTGIQKSSLTPFGARTTTTPAGRNIKGNQKVKKNMFEIVAAHGIRYCATASIGYLQDFMNNPCAFRRVGFHDFKLVRLKASGFPEDHVIHGDFAEVVHGSGFDEIPAEFLSEGKGTGFPGSVNQQADAFPGAADMSSGGVVPALHHRGHTHDQIVMHGYDMRGFLLHHPVQLFVEHGEVVDMGAVQGIVRPDNFIAFHAAAGRQGGDGVAVDPVPVVLKMAVVFGIPGMVAVILQPGEELLLQGFAVPQPQVNDQVVQFRHVFSCGRVA